MYITLIGKIISINGKTFYDDFTLEFGYYNRIDVLIEINSFKQKIEFRNKKRDLLKNIQIGQTVEVYCYEREYYYEKIGKKIKSFEAERLTIVKNPFYKKGYITINDKEYYLKKYFIDSILMLDLISKDYKEIINITYCHEYPDKKINLHSVLIKDFYKEDLIPLLVDNGIITCFSYSHIGVRDNKYAGYLCRLIVNEFDNNSFMKINI